MRRNDIHTFNEIRQALDDYKVRITPFPGFKIIKDREPAVWDYIDKPVVVQAKPRSVLEELSEVSRLRRAYWLCRHSSLIAPI